MDPFHLGDYVFVLRVKPKFCIDLLTNVNHVLENFFFFLAESPEDKFLTCVKKY